MPKTDQIHQLEKAYQAFVDAVNSLTPRQLLLSLGDWTPRDIVAHLIGWNRNVRRGCEQIRTGIAPFYHMDGSNDYRTLNAEFIDRYASTDRDTLLADLAQGKHELTIYLMNVPDGEWDKDFGAKHYRGGPATVGRSVASLTGDYLDHAQEITKGL